jgi:hypothetical protein
VVIKSESLRLRSKLVLLLHNNVRLIKCAEETENATGEDQLVYQFPGSLPTIFQLYWVYKA